MSITPGAAPPCGAEPTGARSVSAGVVKPPASSRRAIRDSSDGCVFQRPARNGVPALVGRRLDVQVRRRVGDARRDLRVDLEPLERERHALGVARDLGGRGVGEVLAASRERELQQRRRDRREDRSGEHADQDERVAAVVAPVAPGAAEERQAEHEVGDEGDHADEHGGEAHQAHVAVADVRHLVREHPLELAARHRVEQPGRHGDVGVLDVPTGGEGVRRGVVDDVERRRDRAGPLRSRPSRARPPPRGSPSDRPGSPRRQRRSRGRRRTTR